MANTSCREQAEALLASCLSGGWRRDLLDGLIGEECSREFFRVVVEGLSDRFDPALCGIYAEMFAETLGRVAPELNAAGLVDRYQRVRRALPFSGEARRVIVLSRVTLGADVAVTSVFLDAAKRRFPSAEILLAGSRKAWELFAADPRIGHFDVPYPRGGSLTERLGPWRSLRNAPEALVLDPDSRLTQLGLLPICDEERYRFFESRAYGSDSTEPLAGLASRWAGEVLGDGGACPYLAPMPVPIPEGRSLATVSLGVGDNHAKRIAEPFEERLLSELLSRGFTVFIDKGAGEEEGERVGRAVERCGGPGPRLHVFQGMFAPFAYAITMSDLYVGYDSAGQHVAAAAGVPLVTVFAGFPSERMFQRWQPYGPGRREVVRVDDPAPDRVLRDTIAALDRLAIS